MEFFEHVLRYPVKVRIREQSPDKASANLERHDIGRTKRNNISAHAQNAQIQIILNMRKVHSGHLHSIHIFCRIQGFC